MSMMIHHMLIDSITTIASGILCVTPKQQQDQTDKLYYII